MSHHQAALPHEYPVSEEIMSSTIHGLGIVLSIVALVILAVAAARGGNGVHITSVCIYGATLILLYTASTLYHGIPLVGAKPFLRHLDRSAIFLLIGGTYTPFALVGLRGSWGWWLFAIVWALALLGIALEWRHRRNRMLMTALYVGIGWVGVIAIRPLSEHLSAGGLWLLFGGGVAYTLGVPFYLWKRLPFNHALWHLFVLLGSALQFFAILYYVLPPA